MRRRTNRYPKPATQIEKGSQDCGVKGTKTLGRRLALRPPVATNSPLSCRPSTGPNVAQTASLPGGGLRQSAYSPSRQCPSHRNPSTKDFLMHLIQLITSSILIEMCDELFAQRKQMRYLLLSWRIVEFLNGFLHGLWFHGLFHCNDLGGFFSKL